MYTRISEPRPRQNPARAEKPNVISKQSRTRCLTFGHNAPPVMECRLVSAHAVAVSGEILHPKP